jgi:two-component system nitrogen regulation response regulator NtrX
MSDILVVDDERDIRELICDILEDEGFTTRRAGTSDECMAELNKAAPGLMILDIWLKDSNMDGIDILKHVKLDNPDVPVVIISGHGNIEIAVAAIKQGAYDFIEKPFNIDQLMVVIRRAMETSRLRRENAQLRRQEVRGTDMIGSSLGGHQAPEIAAGKGHEVQRPRDADGRAGLGQGGRGALDPRQSNRSGAPFRHRVLRRDPARPHGGGPVRPRNAPSAGWSRGFWNRPMAGSSISTRSRTCRWAPSRRSCACWSTSPSPAWAARPRCASICG